MGVKYVDKFESYKINVENISENSVKQYRAILNNLFNFLGKDITNDKDIVEITANDIKDYIEYMAKKDNKPRTKNKSLAVIKTFYKYLIEEEDLDIDSKILIIKKSKVPYREKLWLEETEIDNFRNNITNARTRAMVEMLVHTGMRYSELVNIKLEDYITGKALIVGKGNKQRFVYFNNKEMRKYVDKYIKRKRARILKKYNVESDLLFINDRGKTIAPSNFIQSLKTCAKKDENFTRWEEMSPHVLRHSFITNALLRKEPLPVVRDAVGHSSIAITNNYAHTTKQAIETLMS